MSLLNLQPGESRTLGVTSDKYLIIRSAENHLNIYSDTNERVRIEAGDTLNVDDLKWLNVENPHAEVVQVVYQLTKRELVTTQKTVVAFANKLKVSDIELPVTVSEIQSPLEVAGTVSVKDTPAQALATPSHITILPGTSKQLALVSASRKELVVQNISDEQTEIMIGDSTVSGSKGLPVLGQRETPGGMVLSGGPAVWAYNNSTTTAKVAVMEVAQ